MLNTSFHTNVSSRKSESESEHISRLVYNVFVELGAWTVAVGFISSMLRITTSIL